MVDIVDTETRSRIMSQIRGKDTKAEVQIRKALYALGFRYRLYNKNLPGKPDITLSKYKTVIFINGCFWHYHDCHLFRMPTTNVKFWKKKLEYNRSKDIENYEKLKKNGWRIIIIWECSFRGTGKKKQKEIDSIIVKIVKWLKSNRKFMEIKGEKFLNGTI